MGIKFTVRKWVLRENTRTNFHPKEWRKIFEAWDDRRRYFWGKKHWKRNAWYFGGPHFQGVNKIFVFYQQLYRVWTFFFSVANSNRWHPIQGSMYVTSMKTRAASFRGRLLLEGNLYTKKSSMHHFKLLLWELYWLMLNQQQYKSWRTPTIAEVYN